MMKRQTRRMFATLSGLALLFNLLAPCVAAETVAPVDPSTGTSLSTAPLTEENPGLNTWSEEVTAAYKTLCKYISDNNIPASITLETFSAEYETGKYASLDDCLESYYAALVPMSETDRSSASGKWYYNTNGCTQMPNYSTYNLLGVVKKGDILYEDEGFGGVTGHVAIVEGIKYDSTYGCFYISLIEAIMGDADGVCRSVLYATTSATSYTDTGLTAGTEYRYTIVPVDSQGNTVSNSNYTAITPGEIKKPTIYYANTRGTDTAEVKWTQIPGADKYRVYIAETSTGEYLLDKETTNTYCNTDVLEEGVAYSVRVCAMIGGQEGTWSSGKSFTV